MIIIAKQAEIIRKKGYLHIPNDLLRFTRNAEALREKYNKSVDKKKLIFQKDSLQEKITKLKKPVGVGIDLLSLYEMKEYFHNIGISENQIHKKREEICKLISQELKNSALIIKYKKVIIDESRVNFHLITAIAQYRKIIEKKKLYGKDIFSRGQSNINWNIQASIFRKKKWISNEDEIISEMIRRNSDNFSLLTSAIEILTQMQHYDAPTRLLDLTENPYISLFFAAEDDSDDIDGEVIFFKSDEEYLKYFDSDTISVIANLAFMKRNFKCNINESDIDKFNEAEDIPYLLHKIRNEKNSFLPKIKKAHLTDSYFVKTKLNNKRILNQQGLFLLVGMGNTKTDPADIEKHILKVDNKKLVIAIDNKAKKSILQDLEKMNINKGFIYPEIDKVASYIKETLYAEDET